MEAKVRRGVTVHCARALNLYTPCPPPSVDQKISLRHKVSSGIGAFQSLPALVLPSIYEGAQGLYFEAELKFEGFATASCFVSKIT